MSLPRGAAAEYAEQFLKGHVVPYVTNPLSVAGFVNLLRPDPERVLWHISNLSANDMYVGFSEDVSSTNGILISGNGGFISLNVTEDFDLVTLPVYVFAGEANNQMYLVTIKRETKIKG